MTPQELAVGQALRVGANLDPRGAAVGGLAGHIRFGGPRVFRMSGAQRVQGYGPAIEMSSLRSVSSRVPNYANEAISETMLGIDKAY